MEHSPNHILRVLGIDFIEEIETKRLSLLSRLRSAVKRKRGSLLSAFFRSETDEEDPEPAPTEPVRGKRVRLGLLSFGGGN